MESSLQALCFGKHLMCFLSHWNGYHGDPLGLWEGGECVNCIGQPFHESVARAVEKVIESHRGMIRNVFNELLEEKGPEPSTFALYALRAAPLFFPQGYLPENFVAFCAAVCGVALMFHKYEKSCPARDISNLASYTIGTVLIGHMITQEFNDGGDWSGLNEFSEQFLSVVDSK